VDAFELIRDWLGQAGPEEWVTVASAAVALLSFLFNWRVVRRQEKREAAGLKLAHDSDVIRWSDEVIGELATVHEGLCEKGVAYADSDFRTLRMTHRARLSALIDRGRLFFPNIAEGKKGKDKEEAYRGTRQPALEVLVKAYDLLGGAGQFPGPDRASADELTALRRRFVAEVFKAVDPERRGMTLKEISK
jgi:hypothetical protein